MKYLLVIALVFGGCTIRVCECHSPQNAADSIDGNNSSKFEIKIPGE